jgi:phosphoribosylanthranilate isomerase
MDVTKVKICGITNLKDARYAIECGADALGFNFYEKSPRYISSELAAEIIGELPDGIEFVGVFVNESIDRIVEIAETAGLTIIQLHGGETSDYTSDTATKTGLPTIKAFSVSPGFSVNDLDGYKTSAILLDAFSADLHGGTGKVFNWDVARDVSVLGRKLYLAGGLSAENVADAIRAVRPYAVDACSLLETTPGRKDHSKVAAFIAAARETI